MPLRNAGNNTLASARYWNCYLLRHQETPPVLLRYWLKDAGCNLQAEPRLLEDSQGNGTNQSSFLLLMIGVQRWILSNKGIVALLFTSLPPNQVKLERDRSCLLLSSLT